MKRQGNRVSHTYTMTVDAEGTAVFPLLCPVREYDWIDVWSCDVIYSESGIAELGCVFLTDLPGRGTETWVVTRFEPESVIEFCRTAGTSRTCLLQVALSPGAEGGTTVNVSRGGALIRTEHSLDEAERHLVVFLPDADAHAFEGHTCPDCGSVFGGRRLLHMAVWARVVQQGRGGGDRRDNWMAALEFESLIELPEDEPHRQAC